jgi:hypothetical protein
MFSGDDRPPEATQLKRYTNSAVDVFLAAYRST